ncbi:MAG: helicase-related protein, partial [Candidatus Heimdallarchaeota archaeon]
HSRVIPMTYQMVPVLMGLKLPRTRLLIADDVGLGKTIEAGLILKELVARHLVQRALIVVPANLREQWQDSLQRFFRIDARIISTRHRRILEKELLVGGNPWGHFPFLIVSIDYAKQPSVLQEILQQPWDLIIIDESHKAARPHQSVRGPEPTMQRYALAKKLATHARHILLLTATPHNGFRDSFGSLVEMLNPELIMGDYPDIQINRQLAQHYVCQRRRKDVEEWIESSKSGSQFPTRDHNEEFILPSTEQQTAIDLVNELSDHLIDVTKPESEFRQRLARWTIIHFHKRALSSPQALRQSVLNRLNKIKELLEAATERVESESLSEETARKTALDGDQEEDLQEEEADSRTERLIFGTLESYETEKEILERLLTEARNVKPAKDQKLYQLLKNILPRRLKDSKKIIIFTRYKDTLDYLEQQLERETKKTQRLAKLKLFTIYGEMNPAARQQQFHGFKESSEAVLITTDCLAEGIDLQYGANQIIHYELPWNPNRLEQRNGRVDRFGQPHDKVYIRTLVMKDTLEAAILEKLIIKAQKMRTDYGFAPPFFGDELGVLDAIREFGADIKIGPTQKTLDEYIQPFPPKIDEKLIPKLYSDEMIQDMRKDSFYGHSEVQLIEAEDRMQTSLEAASKEEIREFVKGALAEHKGRLERTDDKEIYNLHLPDEFIEILEIPNEKKPVKVTFDAKLSLENPKLLMVDLESPLVALLVERIKTRMYDPKQPLYARTAVTAVENLLRVSGVYHCLLRYLVETDTPAIMEELVSFGLELFSEKRLDSDLIDELWTSAPRNTGRVEEELQEDIDEALQHPYYFAALDEVCGERLSQIITEREKTLQTLEKKELATGMEEFAKVRLASRDLVALTLYYPAHLGGE